MYKIRRTSILDDQIQSARVTLTPLIDTSLVLLVIFMVATPLLEKHIKVDLPASHAPDEKEEMASELNHRSYVVDAAGMYWDGDTITTIDQIKKDVLLATQNGLQGVTIVGDEKASHAAVFQLLDALKQLGCLHYISIAARQS